MTQSSPAVEQQKKMKKPKTKRKKKRKPKKQVRKRTRKKRKVRSLEKKQRQTKGHGLADALNRITIRKTKAGESKMDELLAVSNTVCEKVESKALPSEDVSTTERIEKSIPLSQN
jgi:hypothetical protein